MVFSPNLARYFTTYINYWKVWFCWKVLLGTDCHTYTGGSFAQFATGTWNIRKVCKHVSLFHGKWYNHGTIVHILSVVSYQHPFHSGHLSLCHNVDIVWCLWEEVVLWFFNFFWGAPNYQVLNGEKSRIFEHAMAVWYVCNPFINCV